MDDSSYTNPQPFYVGKTIHTVAHRFGEHAASGWGPSPADSPLYRRLSRYPISSLAIIPLEQCRAFPNGPGGDFSAEAMSQLLERKWIHILGSRIRNGGLNSDMPGTITKRLHELVGIPKRITSITEVWNTFDHMQRLGTRIYDHDAVARYDHRYRHYQHRIQVLAKHFDVDGNSLNGFNIGNHLRQGYAPRILRKLYDLLEKFPIHQVSGAVSTVIRSAINTEICNRWNLRHSQKTACLITLGVFQNIILDKVRTIKVFSYPQVLDLLPDNLLPLRKWKPIFAHKCVQPLSRLFCNNRAMALSHHGNFEQLQRFAEVGECPCARLGLFCSDKHGHVITADESFLKDWDPATGILEPFFAMGTKYRPGRLEGPITDADIVAAHTCIKRGIDKWVKYLQSAVRLAGLPAEDFVPYQQALTAESYGAFDEVARGQSLYPPNILVLEPHHMQVLRTIHRTFVIRPAFIISSHLSGAHQRNTKHYGEKDP